jgi:hypothetical protein
MSCYNAHHCTGMDVTRSSRWRMLASVTSQAAICKYSSAPRERTTNQRGGLDRGFCLFNNGTYMLVRNNNKYKTFQFQPRQQQHPKQGTPHSWIFFFYSLHSTLQSRDPSRICRILFLFRAPSLAGQRRIGRRAGFRFRRLQWSWSNLLSAAPHAPLTSYNTPISPSFADTLYSYTPYSPLLEATRQ